MTNQASIHLYPLPGRLEGVHDLGLPAPLLRVEVVLPPSRLREGHEDGLDAAARLKAEHGPSVVHQVELHVPFFAVARERTGGGRRRMRWEGNWGGAGVSARPISAR